MDEGGREYQRGRSERGEEKGRERVRMEVKKRRRKKRDEGRERAGEAVEKGGCGRQQSPTAQSLYFCYQNYHHLHFYYHFYYRNTPLLDIFSQIPVYLSMTHFSLTLIP
jgi:hypothetical protein